VVADAPGVARADRRGERAAGGVVDRVRRARRVHASARGAEAFLVAWAGACLALAAAALEADGRLSTAAWTAAAACGALGGASWWCAFRLGPAAAARAIDAGLRCGGALATAFEVGRRGPANELEALLERRVLERVPQRRAVRALVPRSPLPWVAFLGGACALALAVETARSGAADASVAPLAEALADGLGRARAGVLDAIDRGETDRLGDPQELLLRLTDLERTARRAAAGADEPGGAEAAAARVEAIERELDVLSDALAPAGDVARELEDARAWADALRLRRQRGAPPGGTASGRAATADGAADEPASGGAEPPGAAANSLAPGPDAGRMAGPREPPGAPGARADRPERGVAGGTWWSPEYDAVVRGWVEARRAALAGGEPR